MLRDTVYQVNIDPDINDIYPVHDIICNSRVKIFFLKRGYPALFQCRLYNGEIYNIKTSIVLDIIDIDGLVVEVETENTIYEFDKYGGDIR